MMIPSRTKTPLFDEVRRLANLQRAWDHVRSQAVGSTDLETRRERGQIEANPLRYLRSLQRDLGANRFEFELQKGVLKRRPGKSPRPIVVAPLGNRIVQRAILNVCQSNEPKTVKLLGRLPQVLSTPTSVGGLPGRGVAQAMRLIHGAIEQGSAFYVRSDLRNFFANIPRDRLDSFLQSEIADQAFVTLFQAALDVELSNADDTEIKRWWELFPSSELGVPQGSALSAISANIVLSEFDRILNEGALTTVRYLDDFIILGPSEKEVAAGWKRAIKCLKSLGLTAHQPGESDKAAAGKITVGFDFLSFRVRGSQMAPSKAAKSKFVEQISTSLQAARETISENADEPRRAQRRFVQSLDLVDRKIRGWGDAFRETNQRLEFAQLDQALDEHINEFIAWFGRWQRTLPKQQRRRAWGISLLSDTPPPEPDECD